MATEPREARRTCRSATAKPEGAGELSLARGFGWVGDEPRRNAAMPPGRSWAQVCAG